MVTELSSIGVTLVLVLVFFTGRGRHARRHGRRPHFSTFDWLPEPLLPGQPMLLHPYQPPLQPDTEEIPSLVPDTKPIPLIPAPAPVRVNGHQIDQQEA